MNNAQFYGTVLVAELSPLERRAIIQPESSRHTHEEGERERERRVFE